MYKIFDYNDEYTGVEFNHLHQVEEHLAHCPEGYYYVSLWDNYGNRQLGDVLVGNEQLD